MKKNKIIGASFLIIGTSVGSGMLSLPLISASCGLITGIILMILSYSIMNIAAMRLISICSNEPLGINFSNLIKEKLPSFLKFIFTGMYVTFLYILMVVYTSQALFFIKDISKNTIFFTIFCIIFILLFSIIISFIKISDYINRIFISLKIMVYILLISSTLFFLQFNNVFNKPLSFDSIIFAWPTLLPSFGFQNIIPVIYQYQKGNIKEIKLSVWIGSSIVLFIYIIWLIIFLLVVPQKGLYSYENIFIHGNKLSLFMKTIVNITNNSAIYIFLSIFINLSIVSSYICVGLSLYHYINDIIKKKINPFFKKWLTIILTILPPYILSFMYTNLFIKLLQYAAIIACFLFIFLPIYLDKKNRNKIINFYPLISGFMIVIFQIINLFNITNPYSI